MKWKQERFVQEYLVDLDVARAAKRAGYHPKYGWELLRLPEVAAAVADGMAGKRRGAVVRQEEVLAELKKVAMAEASDANGSAVKVAGKLRALELPHPPRSPPAPPRRPGPRTGPGACLRQ